MIFKRAVAKLRAQDWFAITVELVIVILGVFIGTLVANWNQDRLEHAQTRKMVAQLGPTLRFINQYWPTARRYYATTRAYADTAIAGWNGDTQVSDADFVVAAYQATQIWVLGLNGSAFSATLGPERLDQIEDPQLRDDLIQVMTADFAQVDSGGLDTPYRRNVRRLMPIDVQDAIRTQCGDRLDDRNPDLVYLPPNCRIDLPADRVARTAAVLRAHPELVEDLQGHLAAVALFWQNAKALEPRTRRIAAKSQAIAR
jgi:hypothetical protein